MTTMTVDPEELAITREEQALGLTAMDEAAATQTEEQNASLSKEFLANWPHASAGPREDQYDYGAMVAAGYTLTDIPEDPVLPHEFIKPDALNLAGVDVATGAHRMAYADLTGAPLGEPTEPELDDDGEPLSWGDIGYDISEISLATLRTWLRASLEFGKGTAAFVDDLTDPSIDAGSDPYLGMARGARALIEKFAPDTYDKLFGAIAEQQGPKFLEESSGLIENMASLLLQFTYGYTLTGSTSVPVSKMGATLREMGRGALAVQTFPPEEGTLGTALEDMGLLPAFMSFLDSRGTTEDYGRLAGRIAMAVEEGTITASLAGGMMTLGAMAKRMHDADMDTLIEEGVKTYKEGGSRLHEGIPLDMVLAEGQILTGYAGKAVQKVMDGLELIARGLRGRGWGEDGWVAHAEGAGIQAEVAREAWKRGLTDPEPLPGPMQPASPGSRAGGMPAEVLVQGTGEKAVTPVARNWTRTEKAVDTAYTNIDRVHVANPDPLADEGAWSRMQQQAYGGDAIPAPPRQAIAYRQDPEVLAEKLRNQRPELKAAVDEGLKNVAAVNKAMVDGGPEVLGDLMAWGMLSRGRGPVAQESAFLDIQEWAAPFMDKAAKGDWTKADTKAWKDGVDANIGHMGSPAKMSSKSIGDLMEVLGTKLPDGTVPLQELHRMMADPNVTGQEWRRAFFRFAAQAGKSPGIDNKVVSFIAMVGGKSDVLIGDRIQTAHLWGGAENFGKDNVYDGYRRTLPGGRESAEGLHNVWEGPEGLLTSESLEGGLSDTVTQAYASAGRGDEASLGRFHWDTWNIASDQGVTHSTLRAVANRSPRGQSVVEERPYRFDYGARYTVEPDGSKAIYWRAPDGSEIRMTEESFNEFRSTVASEGQRRGITPKDFRVSEQRDAPWYEAEGVDQQLLTELAKEFRVAGAGGAQP